MWQIEIQIDGEWQAVTVSVNRYRFTLRYNHRWDAESMAGRLFPPESRVPVRVERCK